MSPNDQCKILIVDDAPINIHIVSHILENGGYDLSFAKDGPTALDLVKSDHFDLILLDVMMPEMDGFEVAEELKNDLDTRDIPVLFLTAKADAESVVKGFQIGAMDYVTKPFNEAELLARVKTHLELSRSRDELRRMNDQLHREIAERKQVERRYRDMYMNAVQGMFQSTLSGKIIRANPSHARILGYDSPQEIIRIEDGISEICYHPKERDEMVRVLKANGVITNYELRIRRKNDDEPAWILVNARLTQNARGDLIIEGIVTDNTARKLAEEELRRSELEFRYLAVHDNLTSLYNTRYLYQSLAELIGTSKASNTQFSLIFMDIDDFKQVVDTYGHLNGSRAIQEVATTIRGTLTEPAYGVAYGGDEFVVILPEFGKPEAIEKAEEIRLRMSETVYLEDRGHHVGLRASFGVSTYPDDALDMNNMLNRADNAMFSVKKKGKDAISGASGERQEASGEG